MSYYNPGWGRAKELCKRGFPPVTAAFLGLLAWIAAKTYCGELSVLAPGSVASREWWNQAGEAGRDTQYDTVLFWRVIELLELSPAL